MDSNDRQMFVSASLEVRRELSKLVLGFLLHELELPKFVDPVVVGDVGSELQKICLVLCITQSILRFNSLGCPEMMVVGFHLRFLNSATVVYCRYDGV